MKVLVTGAAGRVGANVIQRLVASGAGVRALVMPGDPLAGKLDAFADVDVVHGDLTDPAALRAACGGVTHVIHLAAQMVRGETEVGHYYDVNAVSTLRLLEAARELGAGLERFVLASTDATFRPGDAPPVPLTEDAPQRPVNHYGTSKLLGEVILRHRGAELGIPWTIVRFATVLSPDQADRLFRLKFQRGWAATQRAQGKESTVWPLLHGDDDVVALIDAAAGDVTPDAAVALVGPDGSWRLSAVDVRDAAQGVLRALSEPGAVGRSFNLAAAEPIAHTDAAVLIAARFGVPRLAIEVPMTWRLEIAIDAAREHLGYDPRYAYADTLDARQDDADFVPADEGADSVFAKMSGR
ncbi:MAG: hypothetical protein V7607_3392 [Solirubrobacteraceae bacterium]